jgi:hypothetical protein
LLSDVIGNLSEVEFLVVGDGIVLTFELDVLDGSNQHGSACSEGLEEFPFFRPFNHLLYEDFAFCDFVLTLLPEEFLNERMITRMESRVMPGKTRS